MKTALATVLAATAAMAAFAQGETAAPAAPQDFAPPPVQALPPPPPRPAYGAAYAAPAPQRPERIIVAIGEFDDTDGENGDYLGQLRDRILHRVIGTRKFEVVERADLKKVMSEINYSNAGLTDSSTAPQQGLFKAAGFIVYGKMLFCGKDSASTEIVGLSTQKDRFKCEFQLKISDVETGRILASKVVTGMAAHSGIKTDDVTRTAKTSDNALMRDAVEEAAAFAVDEMRALFYPVRVVRATSRHAIANVTSDEVRIGDVFDVFEDAGDMRDPDTGASLGSEGEYLGRMIVEIPGPKTSQFSPIGAFDMSALRAGCVLRRVSRAALESERRNNIDRKKDRFLDRS